MRPLLYLSQTVPDRATTRVAPTFQARPGDYALPFKEGDGCRHRTGDHKGLYLSPRQDAPRILSPLYLSPRQGSPTIKRIGSHSPCIVGAGEDVDVGLGPLWLPVRALHHISSPYLQCIDHNG